MAVAYFREQLASPAGARIRDYLEKERGLTPETIDKLQLGYAPPGRDALRQRLLKQGFSPDRSSRAAWSAGATMGARSIGSGTG